MKEATAKLETSRPKPKGTTSALVKRKVPGIAMTLFRIVFIIGMAYVLLYPLLVMASRAFRPATDMLNPSIVWIPSGFTMDNIASAWRLLDYPTSVLDFDNALYFTIRVVLISTLLSLVSCSMAGYALGRYKLKFSGLIMALVIFTIVVPMQTYIIPLFFQFKQLSLVNTEWAYYAPAAFGMGLRSGLFILVFMQFFKGMPKELEDAARVDGCSELRTFLQVMIPNAGAPFLVVTLFSIVWYWNDYYFAQMMMSGRAMLSTKLSVLKRSIASDTALNTQKDGLSETVVVFAGALLFILPPLILYLFLQKFFVQSIERTGIVG